MTKLGAAPLDLELLLVRIAADHPDLEFIESAHFSWHAGKKHVSYQKTKKDSAHSILALLHELGHALLGHKDYMHDIQLLQLEVAAWEEARSLAKHYGIAVDDDYIQDCLDTYRDWLHLRATCPTCFARSLQSSQRRYRCHNCGAEWQVSRSRLCRPYRLQKT
ncbi:MAG TPA: hypothetical protein VLE99_05350 [Candidatus Saccharimonadales bacterium]|nr:hypothetical protein [Candidatus Saccharimonadales bacterium]